MPDLVAVFQNAFDRLRVALRGPAGNEERRLDLFFRHQVHHLVDADAAAIDALAQDARTADVIGVAREPQRFGVEIESQHHRATRSVRPRERLVHARERTFGDRLRGNRDVGMHGHASSIGKGMNG
jgi:hypothetical protein